MIIYKWECGGNIDFRYPSPLHISPHGWHLLNKVSQEMYFYFYLYHSLHGHMTYTTRYQIKWFFEIYLYLSKRISYKILKFCHNFESICITGFMSAIKCPCKMYWPWKDNPASRYIRLNDVLWKSWPGPFIFHIFSRVRLCQTLHHQGWWGDGKVFLFLASSEALV